MASASRILERLGHTVHPTYAALTPLTDDGGPFAALAGISLPVTITARSAERESTASGGFLFTHHGYSGPSVLDVSHVAVRSRRSTGNRARSRCAGPRSVPRSGRARSGAEGTGTVAAVIRRELPQRLADALMAAAGVDRHPARPAAPGGPAASDRGAGRGGRCRGPATRGTGRRR